MLLSPIDLAYCADSTLKTHVRIFSCLWSMAGLGEKYVIIRNEFQLQHFPVCLVASRGTLAGEHNRANGTLAFRCLTVKTEAFCHILHHLVQQLNNWLLSKSTEKKKLNQLRNAFNVQNVEELACACNVFFVLLDIGLKIDLNLFQLFYLFHGINLFPWIWILLGSLITQKHKKRSATKQTAGSAVT